MQARQLIVIQGEQQAGLEQAETLLAQFPDEQVITENSVISNVLGKEYLAAIYNTYQGFDPDLVAAMSGTIVAGGVLILITPPLDEWPQYTDPFLQRIANWPFQAKDLHGYYLQRFCRKLRQADFVHILDAQGGNSRFTEPIGELPIPAKPKRKKSFKTNDQSHAVTAITEAINTRQQLSVVIEADRGRGKSAVLGMITKAVDASFVITAPSKKTVEVVFRHAGEDSQLSFVAPDLLCQNLPDVDVLFIDEAASIPSALLTKMLRHYPKIVFSTTIQGYEGTGRGFALRFKQQLDKITPDWKIINLKQPIRYSDNDPLEKVLFDSLLLDAKPVDSQFLQDFDLESCEFHPLTPQQLINNEKWLRETFGLLVLAHYQTRPADCRQILDGKNISTTVVKWHDHVVATALTIEEGGFDMQLAHEIHYGRRRPRGHLVPQSLAVHAGLADAPVLLTTRVMRIVVHPAIQNRGVGSLLLKDLEKRSDADYLSSSFGASPGLLAFWKKSGFEPVRIGLSRDASSGYHSVIVSKPLTDKGKSFSKQALHQFQRYFPILLTEPLRDLEKELVDLLLPGSIRDSKAFPERSQLSKQDQQDIDSFAYGFRSYENCMLALYKLMNKAIHDQKMWQQLTESDKQLLKLKVLDQLSWPELIKQLALSGKKQALLRLRETIVRLIH